MSPDLDVLAAPLRDGFGELVHHRGTTHALWFGFAVGPPLGWLLWRTRDPQGRTPLSEWIGLCVLALVTHPLLDGFTPYGTQFLAPFDRTRFAFHGIGIIDPFYTVILAWAVWGARHDHPASPRARRRTLTALVLSSAYLVGGIGLNEYARRDVRAILGEQVDVRVYPTVLQPFLRRVVARDGDSGVVGWHTTLAPGCPWWERFEWPALTPEAREVAATWQGRTLTWFALGDTILHTERTPAGETVVEIHDLRYGLPGMAPGRSMWGVRGVFGGDRLREVVRFEDGGRDAVVSGFLRWILGRFAETGLRGAHPPSCAG